MQTFKTSKARESILNKIRTALSTQSLPIPYPDVEKENAKSVYTDTGLSLEETFAESFIGLGGKFVFCDNELDLLENIHTLSESRGWQQVFCSDNGLMRLFSNNKLNMIMPVADLQESADACITGCEILVARTGSILQSSRQSKGRTASIYSPVHIVVAYPDQLVKDVDDGMKLILKRYGDNLPSMISLSSGPSRTADIEKTLVTGVHGPGEVFCFLVNI